MKKIKSSMVIVMLILSIALVGCVNSGAQSKKSSTEKSNKLLTKSEFGQMFSNANKFEGRKVDYYAKVSVDPEKDSNVTYIQAFADPDNSEQNTIVKIKNPNFDVKKDDIIHVVGKVVEKHEGKNAFGGDIVAPVISASKIEKTDYATAFDPAKKTITVNKQINQNGYVVQLNKVEFGTKNTRVYVTVTNSSNAQINFNTFEAKATQGDKQYDVDSGDLNYPEMKTEILPGVKEDGIIIFKPIDYNGENIKFIFTGSSDDFEQQFTPFTFDVNVK